MKKVTYSRSYSYPKSRTIDRAVITSFAGIMSLVMLLGTFTANPVFAWQGKAAKLKTKDDTAKSSINNARGAIGKPGRNSRIESKARRGGAPASKGNIRTIGKVGIGTSKPSFKKADIGCELCGNAPGGGCECTGNQGRGPGDPLQGVIISLKAIGGPGKGSPRRAGKPEGGLNRMQSRLKNRPRLQNTHPLRECPKCLRDEDCQCGVKQAKAPPTGIGLQGPIPIPVEPRDTIDISKQKKAHGNGGATAGKGVSRASRARNAELRRQRQSAGKNQECPTCAGPVGDCD